MSALKLCEAASVSRAIDSELSGTQLRGSANAKADVSRAVQPARRVSAAPRCQAGTEQEPLLVRAARSQPVPRPPAWMMRQAGRYMKVYQELTKKHPSFRERSETTDLIVEITLQPWQAFAPDGVILFSDILTPLDAMGIPFEIDESKGPIIDKPIRTHDALKALHDIDLDRLKFVDESLRIIRKEISAGQPEPAALLGFVGAPYTLATYCVEGGSTRTYTKIKGMLHDTSEGGGAEVLHKLLSFLAEQIATYVGFQVDAGAQCVQIFDSWGGQLTPEDWDRWSRPYIEQIIKGVRETHPGVPLVFYINGNGGLLERMAGTGADVIGLDWTLDMADARRRLGTQAVQGNVDPAVLFASQDAITNAVHSCVRKAGPRGHILNLGHGVLVGTPEHNVKHFFDTVRGLSYDSVFADAAVPATAAAAR